MKYKTFQEAFLAINKKVSEDYEASTATRNGKALECFNVAYSVDDVYSYIFSDKRIDRISYNYADLYYNFMMTGKTNYDDTFADYPNVKKFMEKSKGTKLPANFNTFYGPRIVRQLCVVVNELGRDPMSRRATIHILNESDNQLLDSDETLEFACTQNMTYFIRDSQLHCQCNMRSQNVAVVMQLDMYIQAKLQLCILALLQKKYGVKLSAGAFYSCIVNAHILQHDISYVHRLLS